MYRNPRALLREGDDNIVVSSVCANLKREPTNSLWWSFRLCELICDAIPWFAGCGMQTHLTVRAVAVTFFFHILYLRQSTGTGTCCTPIASLWTYVHASMIIPLITNDVMVLCREWSIHSQSHAMVYVLRLATQIPHKPRKKRPWHKIWNNRDVCGLSVGNIRSIYSTRYNAILFQNRFQIQFFIQQVAIIPMEHF